MGHRAIVAYERPTGGYTVRYSQWGAHGYRLLDAITASTPLGGRRGDDGPQRVRPDPIGVVAAVDELAATHVDPLAHEAAFVVDDAFDVGAFEPLAFWPSAPTAAYGGALVALTTRRDPGADARELRAWRRGAAATALPDGDGSTVELDERERVHRRLLAALEREADDRRVAPIPPRTRDLTSRRRYGES